MKVSSRTMHIPWDDAGCLCPVGDFFNYAAPGEETLPSEVVESSRQSSSLQVCSSLNDGTTEKSQADVFGIHSQRLTDAEYRDDVAAYCFYAREKYKKGEQVHTNSFKSILQNMLRYGCLVFFHFKRLAFHLLFFPHLWVSNKMFYLLPEKKGYSFTVLTRLGSLNCVIFSSLTSLSILSCM